MANNGDILVGLDIGTTKICAIVGEVTDEGIDIIGIGTHPSKGLRKGVVVNIDATVASIKRAIEEAELMAGCEITTVYTGIAGGHIKAFPSHGVVAIKDKEVKQADVDRVIDAGQGGRHPARPRGHPRPPAGVHRRRPGRHPRAARDERRPARGQGAHRHRRRLLGPEHREVRPADRPQRGRHRPPAARQLRSATLSDDERELGVCLVDIGGGTTDIAIFVDGAIAHTAVLSLGGNHLTNDIAVGLRTPTHEAERIKKSYGCALASMVDKSETIEVPSVGGSAAARPLPADPRRDHRAPRRGDLHAGPARDPEGRAARSRSPRAWSSPAGRRSSPA